MKYLLHVCEKGIHIKGSHKQFRTLLSNIFGEIKGVLNCRVHDLQWAVSVFHDKKVQIVSCKHLYPQSSKIHEPLVNRFPELKPILSAINTGACKWQKLFIPLLKPFTSNNCTVKDSFDIAKDTTQQNFKLFMASLDVDSLFTNVALDETGITLGNRTQCKDRRDIKGGREIGLQFLASVLIPFLNKGFIFAILHCNGIVSSFIDRLIILTR